ncbi:response regulator transcription factor [Aliarcobacter butzleri]|uniref:response regulator transcription factor n=1 Tax=Aliarcobacter butzleri TaxID=28197 RepID=UPI001EDBAA14|nr:response regulator transcription factor [Aliarcobacter butzleri]MCG3661777.1 response regulator transcription factor [Aliarcobacter butzleri]MCR8709488.1 response regulator transcription factor [Aliarcobacter butzleri]
MTKDLMLFKQKTVLFIEDDNIIKNQISEVLSMLFDEVFTSDNGKDGLELYKLHSPDLIISDIKMPIMDGLSLAEKIRNDDYNTPIILLTNFNEKEYLLNAVNLSVDGYILKPLEFNNLITTIKKSLQRNLKNSEQFFLAEDLFFNFTTSELYYKNCVVHLGVKELELLKLLIENYPKTVTKDEIYSALWSYDEISESSIKNLILRIRKKIEQEIIVSVRGLGYRLEILNN